MKKGDTEDPIQLEDEDPASEGSGRAPSPDLPMVQTGGDGDRVLTRIRRGVKTSTASPPVTAAIIPVTASEVRAPPPPSRTQNKSNGKEVPSVGTEVIWPSGQSVESFVEEVHKEVRKEAQTFVPQIKDPKYFRPWVKQLVKVSPFLVLSMFSNKNTLGRP